MEENGGQVYVRFGPHPTDMVPIEWAEAMLSRLKKDSPMVFGRLLMAAVGIERGAH